MLQRILSSYILSIIQFVLRPVNVIKIGDIVVLMMIAKRVSGVEEKIASKINQETAAIDQMVNINQLFLFDKNYDEKICRILKYMVIICLCFSIVLADWRPELPKKKKYFFSSREILNFGTVARFSEHFDAKNAEDWTLHNAFWAYPEEYPGTVVNR